MAFSSTQVFLICSFLTTLATLCLSESVSLRASSRQRNQLARRSDDAGYPPHDQFRFLPPPSSSSSAELDDDYELLDICLLASVDGKFHGLNRTSGQILWSMSAPSNGSSSGPAALAPLVRTQHLKSSSANADPDDDEHTEMYIIEPQSGDIYVLPNPDAPLQAIPLTMSRLVDVSPFSLPNDNDRVFVGKKETSLLMLELETGKLQGTLDSSSECPWNPFAESEQNADLDLDELDGTKPSRDKPVSTRVLIGRTDYQMTIHTRSQSPSSRPSTQILNFSAYGPNNQDQGIQASYQRTLDDMYIQVMPTGEVLSFAAASPKGEEEQEDGFDGRAPKPRNKLVWANTFKKPIVAVFDVLRSPNRQQPLVLLQPQPRFEDIFPDSGAARTLHSNLDATYIGYLEESGALFAMSPIHYPLVLFHPFAEGFDPSRRKVKRPTIDAPPTTRKGVVYEGVDGVGEYDPNAVVYDGMMDEELDVPMDLDDVTRARKLRELCSRPDGSWDGRCLVGKRPVGSSSRSRSFRLLDGVPSAPSHSPDRGEARAGRSTVIASGEVTDDVYVYTPVRAIASNQRSRAVVNGTVVASVVFLIGLWYVVSRRRVGGGDEVNGDSSSVVERTSTKVDTSNPSSVVEDAQSNRRSPVPAPAPVVNPIETSGIAELVVKSGPSGDSPTSTTPALSVEVQTDSSTDDSYVHVSRFGTQSPTTVEPTPVHVLPPSSSPALAPASTPASVPPIPAATSVVLPSDDAGEDGDAAEDESDREGGGVGNDSAITPGRKKGARRRKRGKKNKGAAATGTGAGVGVGGGAGGVGSVVVEASEEVVVGGNVEAGPSVPAMEVGLSPPPLASPVPLPPVSNIVVTPQQTSPTTQPLLQVSDEILGLGSHGTIVYRGSLQGRAVAVKRLLQDFVTLASREVDILQESDDHPNVIRYFYQERHQNFLYIALELCPANLADVIERPDVHREISNSFDPKRALTQITSGLRHLHALKIIHRDIKPQNILISAAKRGAPGSAGTGHRMLISDFGLCKKLDVDQTSFMPTTNGAMAAGTVGWRAPEILRGEVKIEELVNDETSISSNQSNSSVGTATNGTVPPSRNNKNGTRLTKSVDVFALGCLYYYTLTNGSHPYGDRYEREVNIIKDSKSLVGLESFGEEGLEAIDLIMKMLNAEASARPDTTTCLIHPFFWTPSRRLTFLQDASDRFEIMCRDPPDAELVELETDAFSVVGNDWNARLDRVFIDNLGKFRKYDKGSVRDLLRALRNKKHHYQDLPDNVKRHLGPLPDGFLSYFTRRFPNLFMHVHNVVSKTNLRFEPMFKSYFELTNDHH